ncbi:MAG: hypothetical protein KDB29_03150, partial [Planctomycetes bacterium]|nr:hypothetical protein [Planctomycetota bacterium]
MGSTIAIITIGSIGRFCSDFASARNWFAAAVECRGVEETRGVCAARGIDGAGRGTEGRAGAVGLGSALGTSGAFL